MAGSDEGPRGNNHRNDNSNATTTTMQLGSSSSNRRRVAASSCTYWTPARTPERCPWSSSLSTPVDSPPGHGRLTATGLTSQLVLARRATTRFRYLLSSQSSLHHAQPRSDQFQSRPTRTPRPIRPPGIRGPANRHPVTFILPCSRPLASCA